jgi:outer membrane protein assembly factor BamE
MRVSTLTLSALGLCLALGAGGCVYRVNIPQGNYLEAKSLDQVQVGMTRSQVRYLLGTPMLADPFHPDRWDYLYYFKLGKTQKVDRRLVVIYFAEDKVLRIDKPEGPFKNPTQPVSPGA